MRALNEFGLQSRWKNVTLNITTVSLPCATTLPPSQSPDVGFPVYGSVLIALALFVAAAPVVILLTIISAIHLYNDRCHKKVVRQVKTKL